MKISVQISADGKSTEIKTISILEDYWHDYLYFREQANIALKEGSQLRNRRYSRAALLVLMAYLEGVVNQWCIAMLKHEGRSRSRIKKYIQETCLAFKCNFLTTEASKRGSPIVEVDIKRTKGLRNDLAHLKPGKDLDIFREVSESLLAESEGAIISWLEAVGKLLRKKRHPNTKEIGRRFANALCDITSEEYSEK